MRIHPLDANSVVPKDPFIERSISVVRQKSGAGALVTEADNEVDVFIKAKLLQWDKNQDGAFREDEVEAAMEEWQRTIKQADSEKFKVVLHLAALITAAILVLCAIGVAYATRGTASISDDGQWRPRSGTDTGIVVTVQEEGVGGILSLVSYDETTDAWAIDDPSLRNLDAISFASTEGVFYHLRIASLRRFDSGPDGDMDELNILTVGGHELRLLEGLPLEVRWANTTLWETVNTSLPESDRLLQSQGESHSSHEPDALDQEPPRVLLSKGGGWGGSWTGLSGGSWASGWSGSTSTATSRDHTRSTHWSPGLTYVHSRGGYYTCSHGYMDGVDDPSDWCQGAGSGAGFSRLSGSWPWLHGLLLLLFLVLHLPACLSG